MAIQPVAFFDIDGTLFRSSLLIELVEELIAAGLFPASARNTYTDTYALWQARQGTYEAYISSVIAAFQQHIAGVHYGDFADLGQQIVSAKGKCVYRYTRSYIDRLKQEGYSIIAISQSPKTILDNFCREYGFDKVYGRLYAIDSMHRFTGETLDEQLIANKANIVSRVFARHPDITAAGSIAVGDTDGDIPLLSAVEHPVCFNPNRALYDHATEHNWPIVVERKDVIYKL